MKKHTSVAVNGSESDHRHWQSWPAVLIATNSEYIAAMWANLGACPSCNIHSFTHEHTLVTSRMAIPKVSGQDLLDKNYFPQAIHQWNVHSLLTHMSLCGYDISVIFDITHQFLAEML